MKENAEFKSKPPENMKAVFHATEGRNKHMKKLGKQEQEGKCQTQINWNMKVQFNFALHYSLKQVTPFLIMNENYSSVELLQYLKTAVFRGCHCPIKSAYRIDL